MSLDASRLQSAVSDEAPSGPNLEYDAAFLEMVAAAEAKPERQMGDSVIEAQDPDWKAVKANAVELCERTKDLRVFILLAQAVLHTDGFGAMSDALVSMRVVLDEFWPSVHPELDPDDQDPMMRVNAIASLADPNGLIKQLRSAPLVSSKVVGRFSMRDIQLAESGQGGEGAPSMDLIGAAFMDVSVEQVEEASAAVCSAHEACIAIDEALTSRLGGQAPDLQPVLLALKEISGELAARWSEKDAGAPVAAEEASEGGGGAPATAARAAAVSDRKDVVRMIDLVCDYYQRCEPSSPVPVLLQRARKLVDMNFLDVVRDLVPGGLDEAERIRGEVEES